MLWYLVKYRDSFDTYHETYENATEVETLPDCKKLEF